MICSTCGFDNPAGRKFCEQCGARFASTCATCGSVLGPTAKFCGECGTAQSLPATLVGAAEPARAPASAERRVVSVLFADLVGFTTYSENRDAEEVRETLTRYFQVASDIVGRYGGTVEKFIGDAVMAVWGVPSAHEDDAERAVRAGLDIVDAVTSLASGVQARCGVFTGEAAVTLGARDQGMVAGDIVNTASRLQSLAPPGGVLVGGSTQRAASAAIAFEEAGEQVVRGKTAAVPAWRALRVVADRGGRHGVEGLEPPFVGREDELRLLRELFHTTTRDRRARLVSVVGQPGIGKSRLAWELEKYLDGLVETVYWHAGRSPAYGTGITFWALGEMVRRRAKLAEGADERATRAAIAEMLTEFVVDADERRWIEPRLLTLLAVGEAPSGGREELFAAWRTLFERIAERGTTALVFEDLQWADPGLLDFIEHVLEWSRGLPIFVLTLSRPELLDRRPGWGASQSNAVSMRLETLRPPAMRKLLDGLVPGLPAPLAERILARADGVPLYAVETVRMLMADGRLAADHGAYRPTVDLSSLEVPESLAALVGARLDALDPADRSLAQDAAVLGHRFTTAALTAVAGIDADDAERRLRDLVRREIFVLETDPRSPERGQHGFVQALLREVAYATLSRRDRRVRHVAAARYFESLGDEELAGALAEQYLAAWRASADGIERDAAAAQARLALRAAADRAVALGSFEQAIVHLESALEVASSGADEAALLERIGEIAVMAGLVDRAEQSLRRAVELARSLGDEALVVRATAELATALILGSHIGKAVAELEPLAETARGLDDATATALFSATMAQAQMRSAHYREAIEWADRAIPLAESQALDMVVAQALVTKATALVHDGRRREGMALLVGATQFADDRGFNLITLRGYVNLAANGMAEDPRLAGEYVRRGIALGHRLGLNTFLGYFVGNGYSAALRSGEWAWFEGMAHEVLVAVRDAGSATWTRARLAAIAVWRGTPAEGVFDDEVASARAEGDPQTLGYATLAQAQAAYVEGAFAASARVIAEQMPNASPWPYVRAFGGRAALLAGDLAGARSAWEAAETEDPSGALLADTAMLRAGVAALEGRRDEAIAGYRSALARYRELGLRFDLALTVVEAVQLIGSGDPFEADADEAGQILADLGADPIASRLERLVSQGAVARAKTTAASRDSLVAPARPADQPAATR